MLVEVSPETNLDGLRIQSQIREAQNKEVKSLKITTVYLRRTCSTTLTYVAQLTKTIRKVLSTIKYKYITE